MLINAHMESTMEGSSSDTQGNNSNYIVAFRALQTS